MFQLINAYIVYKMVPGRPDTDQIPMMLQATEEGLTQRLIQSYTDLQKGGS